MTKDTSPKPPVADVSDTPDGRPARATREITARESAVLWVDSVNVSSLN
jgi:hypothetical protein